MPERKETVRFQATGNLDAELKKIADATEKASGKMDEMGAKFDAAGKKVSKSSDDMAKSVKGFAASFATFEVAKAILQKLVAFLSDAKKKFIEAELASGKTLKEISKNSEKLTKDIDRLTLSIGKLIVELEEAALQGDPTKKGSLTASLAILIDQNLSFTNAIVGTGDAAANVVANMFGLGVAYEGAKTGIGAATDALREWGVLQDKISGRDEKGAGLSGLEKDVARFVSRFDLNGMLTEGIASGKAAIDKFVKPPAKKKGGTRKKKEEFSAEGVDFSGDFGDAVDQASLDAEAEADAKKLKFTDDYNKLLLEGKDYEADVLDINNSNLTQNEHLLRLKEAQADQREREDAAAASLVDSTRKEVELMMTKVDSYQAAGTGILDLMGAQDAAKIASAAIDGAQAQYMALFEFGVGNFAGAAAMQVAAVQAFALAGKSATSAMSGGGAKPKRKAATERGGSSGSSQNAREQASASTSGGPSTTVYQVNFTSLTKPTPREARAIAESLNVDARSRV